MEKETQMQNEKFHIGELIKNELAKQGRSITWLAEQINCTRENLYKLFKSPWINTHTLFKIGKALDYDFFKLCSDYFNSQRNEEKS
mgnify:CR=1 FL=1